MDFGIIIIIEISRLMDEQNYYSTKQKQPE